MKKLQKHFNAIALAKSAFYPISYTSILRIGYKFNHQVQSELDFMGLDAVKTVSISMDTKKKLDRKSKNMASLAKSLLSLALLLLFYSVGICQENYVVTATKLNVRKQASTESTVVGTLSKDDEVRVFSFKGGWA